MNRRDFLTLSTRAAILGFAMTTGLAKASLSLIDRPSLEIVTRKEMDFESSLGVGAKFYDGERIYRHGLLFDGDESESDAVDQALPIFYQWQDQVLSGNGSFSW